uniref:C2H2-type domain-containing protein n=1 Tax=Angiostrongylus cantonensis TaxID=6313 RepID=A0A0K0CZ56_ANGCA
MFHLREAHGVPLFFFCKACHLGGPHERTIYAHVAVKSHRCRQFAEQKNWSHTATIGVCPMNVLHYQPKNHVSHDLMLQRGSELAMTLDNGTEFPFTSIYDQIPSEGSSVAPSRAIAPRPISMDVPSCVGGLTNSVRNTSDTSGSSTSWLPVRSHQHSSSNSQQVAAVSSPSNGRGTVPLKRRTPAINSDVITLSDDEPGPSTAKRLPMQICRTLMPTPQIQSLHELHTNGMKWFCLDCATPHMDEIEAVKHYFNVHVKVAEQKALAKGMLFRPIHYQLQCPFPKCRLPLSTLTNLRLHLNNRHRAETTSSST